MSKFKRISNAILYLTALKKWFVYRLKIIANLNPRLVILNGVFRLLYPIRWNSLISINLLQTVGRIRFHSPKKKDLLKRFAYASLAGLALQLVLPLAGLIQPVQANNLIKPTQKGDSLFESVNPGFTAEFGDRGQPTQHKLRFEAKPELIEANDKRMEANELMANERMGTAQKIRESIIGAAPKGIELRLVETGQVLTSDSLIGDNSLQAEGLISSNSLENNESLKEINKGLEETKSSLEKIEEKLTSVSKDVAEVTKVTKNILEESGVGKPELSVRPSMEETPEDFARTAGYNNYNDYNGYNERPAPPATLTAPIDTVSQTIDETTKVEYQVIVGRGVKESITLLEKDAILPSATEGSHPSTFTFELKLDQGVQVRQTIDGIQSTSLNSSGFVSSVSLIYFTDQFGRYLFHFETPYMIDAAGAKSSAVELKLTDQIRPGLFEKARPFMALTLTADPAWLQAEARVYPILIDPTIVHEDNPAFSSGTENRSQTTNPPAGGPAVEIQYKELQPDINTVGLWHFNEGSSTTAYDASGNANNGTLTNGPVWNGPTDTILGKSSLKFDDANDYVTTADAASLDLTTNGTIEAWVKPNAIEDNNWIVCKASNYCVGLNSTGAVLYTGASAQNDGGTGVTTANQWYHIAVTNNNTTATYYVNGVTTGTDAVAWGSTLTNALEFGRDGGTNYFDGTIDEIRISNVVRSPEEIAASASRYPYAVHESPVIDFGSTPNSLDSLNYSATGVQTGDGEKPFSSDGLVAQWNFNETSGTTAYNTAGADSCGGTPSSCNGTLTTFASTASQDQAAGTGWTSANRRWGSGALMFDGTNDYVAVTDNNSLDIGTSDFTLGAWIKTNGGNANGRIIAKRNSAVGTNPGYIIGLDGSGHALINLSDGSATRIMLNGTTVIIDGQWHYVTGSFDRDGSMTLYVDGKSEGSTSISAQQGSLANTLSLYIGRDEENVASQYFNGTIDSTRIYSRALTATEILSNYQSGNVEFQTRTGATADPNDGTWEAWKTTSGTGDTQIDAMDATTGWAWDGNASDPTSVALDTATKIEGTGSLKNILGMPESDANTVALWHIEETSNGAGDIKDSSPNGYNLTPQSAPPVADGFYGKTRDFDGSADYLESVAAGGVNANNKSSLSFSLWVYPDTQPSINGNNRMILKDDGFYVYQQWQTGNSNSLPACSFSTATGTYHRDDTTDKSILPIKKWTHIACTWDGSDVKIYINGNQVSDDTNGSQGSGNISDANTNPTRIAYISDEYFDGKADEVVIADKTWSAEEIAEAFRAGRDHRISKTITASDLSAKTKIPFFVAADRPGTFMEATVGESAYANYETDANTVGLWHLDEQTGSGAYIKDSSGSGNNGTPTGTTFVQGKIGKATQIATAVAQSNEITISDAAAFDLTTNMALGAWVYPLALPTGTQRAYVAISRDTDDDYAIGINILENGTSYITFSTEGGPTNTNCSGSTSLSTNQWYHVVATYDGSNKKIYINGQLDATCASTGSMSTGGSETFIIGNNTAATTRSWAGYIDEVRLSNTARTADEIRQAFEIGKRTHAVTIDFKADLDSSNLIANTSDLSFAINPDVDTAGVGEPLNIAKGEKIIVKENVNGTEYIAQGTVSAVTYASGISNANAPNQNATNASTSTITVTAWDSGATVPSGGFTTAATVFKWQREYLNLLQIPLNSHRDAVTRITLRVTDGSQGSTVWLDDFESADYSGGAMTGSNSASIAIGSTAQRYFQYRAILTNSLSSSSLNSSTFVPSVSLTAVQINYNSGTTPQPPRTKDASTDFSATGTSLNRVTDTGSSNSPQLELAYKELPKDINTVGLWHMNENTSNTIADSSGNSHTGTFAGNTAFTTSSRLGASAISSDGTDDYINVADSDDWYFGSGEFTIESWVNFAATPTQTVFTSQYKENVVTDGSFKFGYEGSGTRLYFVYSTTGTDYTYLYSPNWTPSTSTWYHLAVTRNSGNLRFYIDGVQFGSDQSLSATLYNSTRPLTLFASTYNAGTQGQFSLNGKADELRISKVGRTPEEIRLDAQRRPYGVYTSDVQNLGTQVSSIDNLRWTENGVQTGDAERPFNDNGLVAQWNFNETSGTTATVTSTSSCGSTCNGTLTTFASTASQDQAAGTGWTKDNRKWGAGALMTDNTNDYVLISSQGISAGSLTLETWINPATKPSSDERTIWSQGNTSSGRYMAVELNSTGKADFYTGSTRHYTNGEVPIGQWSHLVVTHDSTASTKTKLYLNGILQNDTGTGTLAYTGDKMTLANGPIPSSSIQFNGVLDSTRLYSRALGASEILSNYQAGNVELQTRTGTTTTPNDGTWEAWKPTTSETALDAVDSLSPVEKISQTSLTAYWKLDETSGTRADSKGSNTLTDNNTVTYAPGRLGNAGQFTAANSEYLSIADNAALSTGDIDFSIAAWVNADSLSGSNRGIVGKYDTVSPDREYLLWYENTDNRFGFRVTSDGTNATNVNANSLGAPSTGQWYFIVAWHDATANTINIQVNNGAVDSTSHTTGVRDDTSTFYIGGREATDFWNGKIDEVAFWKRTLTAAERTRLFEDGLDLHGAGSGRIYRSADTTTKMEGTGSEKLEIGSPKVDSSTVGLWHMEETSGTGAYIKDATANANNGTPTGTTVVDGFFGKARSFNGTSDFVTMSHSSSLNFGNTGKATIELWFKADVTNQNMALINKYNSLTNREAYRLGLTSAGKIYLEIFYDASNYRYYTSNSTYDTKWHHLASIWDWDNFAVPELYIDGVKDTGGTTGSVGVDQDVSNNVDVVIGRYDVANYFSGTIDEVRVSNTARTAEEIAEAYRAGRDHRLTKTISSKDLSNSSKLPYYIAADRPGTYLEATVGESAFANYEPDANTVGLWHLEEQTGSGAYIKDSSGNGNNGTPTGTTFVQGKIGKGRSFNGSSDYIDAGNGSSIGSNLGTGNFTVGAWIKTSQTTSGEVVDKYLGSYVGWYLRVNGGTTGKIYFFAGTNSSNYTDIESTATINDNNWHHIVGVRSGAGLKLYVDGVEGWSASFADVGTITNVDSATNLRFGTRPPGDGAFLNGALDEVRVSNTARTADDIRQAYEIGKRTHQITNDFVTTPQAAYSSGTSVTINNPYGTTNLTDTLSIGETMIFKENVGGTETVSQAVVTGITNTSSVYGTVTLLAAPSFPSGGYTTNATVFKWQREFFDITSSLASQRDAVTRLSLRVIDGSQGANVWLDDFKSAGPYLSVGSARTSTIASTPQQYFQYRVIFTTTDTAVSPTVTSISVQYHSDPQKVTGADTFASGTYDRDGNVQLGSNNVKDVQFYDRTKDQISYAMDFDGSNDYVSVADSSSFDGTKTYEFWFRPDTGHDSSEAGQFIMDSRTDDGTEFELRGNQSNSGKLLIDTYSGVSECYVYTTVASWDDRWYHIATVLDDTNDLLRVYIDGTQDNTAACSTLTSFGNPNGSIAIGSNNTPGAYFDGKIDEVALFSDVRTPAEVANDYNARRISDSEGGLVALYHFDEGKATNAMSNQPGNIFATDTNSTLEQGLVSYWNLNEVSGTRADSTGTNYLTDNNTVTSNPGKVGTAGQFTRANSEYLSIADNADLSTGDIDFSIAGWVYLDSKIEFRIVSKADTNEREYVIEYSAGNDKFGFAVSADGVNNVEVLATTPSPISINTWYFIVVRHDSVANTIGIQVNNGTEYTTAHSLGVRDGTSQFNIGRESVGGGGHYMNGLVDEVGFWKKALTAQERTDLYNSGNADKFGNPGTLTNMTDDDWVNSLSDKDQSAKSQEMLTVDRNWPNGISKTAGKLNADASKITLASTSAVNNDRAIELQIVAGGATATATYKWRYVGDQTWSSTAATHTASTELGTTGVSIAFTTGQYWTNGDTFTIDSWALEQFSNADTNPPAGGAMRGTKRGFPERSYLVATDKGVDILNADDNTLWMRTEQGSGRSLGADFNNDPSSIFMSHGQLFVGTNGTAGTGLYRYDFNRDKIYRYNATNRTTNTVNIAKRNTADSSYGSADTAQNLISSVVNDAHAITIQGKLLLAAATDTGVTKISNIMSSDTSYDYSDNASDDYGHVVLAENAAGAGDLYADNDTTDALERWNNVLDDAASETAGTPDTTYDESSTPAIFTSAQEINSLALTSQTSLTSPTSPTIYLAHDAGTTALHEKRSDPTNGSVKYENVSRITEEMIGDTNGMWSLDDVNDSSVKANNLTNNASVTFTTSGVRGKSAHFTAASSQYLSKADNASLSTGDIDFTVSAWVYFDSTGVKVVVGKEGTGSSGEYRLVFDEQIDSKIALQLLNSSGGTIGNAKWNTALSTGIWYHVMAWHDSVNNQVGITVNNGTPVTEATTGVPADTTAPFTIGAMRSSPIWYMDGRIDEVLFTKEVLTAAQRTQLYVSGREALNNKYRVKLASDTVNELAGDDNTVKAIGVSKLNQTGVTRGEYLYVGTNGTSADDGSLSRILVNGDTRDREYDESTKEPYLLTDNDINSVSISNDGAYIVVGTDDAGVTIIQNGSNAVRLRGGSKIQGPYKRPHN